MLLHNHSSTKEQELDSIIVSFPSLTFLLIWSSSFAFVMGALSSLIRCQLGVLTWFITLLVLMKTFTIRVLQMIQRLILLPIVALIKLPLLIKKRKLRSERQQLMLELKEARAEADRLQERKREVKERKELLLRQIYRIHAEHAIHLQQIAEINGTTASLAA